MNNENDLPPTYYFENHEIRIKKSSKTYSVDSSQVNTIKQLIYSQLQNCICEICCTYGFVAVIQDETRDNLHVSYML